MFCFQSKHISITLYHIPRGNVLWPAQMWRRAAQRCGQPQLRPARPGEQLLRVRPSCSGGAAPAPAGHYRSEEVR